MNLANKITIIRIVLIPVFIITLLNQNVFWPIFIFTATILTDALDGFVARYRKEKTALGSFLDPLADKVLMLSSFITLTYLGKIPLSIFVIVLSRDFLIVMGWTIIYLINGTTDVEPRLLGKLTTIFQMVTIWFVILGKPGELIHFLLIITLFITIFSGLDYVIHGSRKLNHNA